MSQVTVISGVERRRVWTDEQKLALVEATLAPGANVAEIARRADLRPSQIYRWRRHLLDPAPARPMSFAPVVVAAEPPAMPSRAAAPRSSAALTIELEGAVVRIAAEAPHALVSAVLKGLKR